MEARECVEIHPGHIEEAFREKGYVIRKNVLDVFIVDLF
jgi:hypothetical protein